MSLLKTHMNKVWSKNIKTVLLFIGIMLVVPAISFAQEKTIIDKVVAQIGDEVILLSDIQQQQLQLIQNGQEESPKSKCKILEDLMFEKLLINQAKIDSIEVSNDMVNAEMEQRIRYIADQIGSIEALEEFYGKSVAKIKAEFFELIKKRIMAEQMKDQITSLVTITPKEVEKFYKDLPTDSIPYINSKVSIAQIVIYPDVTEKDQEIARKKLDQIRTDIIEGKMLFGTAAFESEDPGSRLNGGGLGWQTRGTMVPEFEAVIYKLEKGEISEVFETPYGYHIIKLIERKGDNYDSKHILIMPKPSDEEFEKAALKIDSLYSEIKKGTITFETAASRFSDDKNSKMNQGKVVNPYSGDYLWDVQNINEIDPQMSRIVEVIDVGDYSSPSTYYNQAENQQGFRMVKLLNRTEPHIANLKTDRQLIEMAAKNQKDQKVIDKWVSDKIGGSFVRIDDEYSGKCNFKHAWLKSDL
ncbi:peptidylprolyl isomerase [Crocinitomix catalasitica]|uniref:peptidylprolyl isomerase n=1 Tax=Crocinitomix catalasitica TaxID=184607 RepID=UPI0004876816|nr:peptidylprolyl isomerase [Crocinitomix catalasitica]